MSNAVYLQPRTEEFDYYLRVQLNIAQVSSLDRDSPAAGHQWSLSFGIVCKFNPGPGKLV